jgi:hypothetical protein
MVTKRGIAKMTENAEKIQTFFTFPVRRLAVSIEMQKRVIAVETQTTIH